MFRYRFGPKAFTQNCFGTKWTKQFMVRNHISYCCNIAINTSCSVVSPKVTIVPIRNITVDQCDKLYLLAKIGENVVWLHDNKIVSIVPFTYSVQLVSEETSVMCSACAACSIVVNVLKRHGHH